MGACSEVKHMGGLMMLLQSNGAQRERPRMSLAGTMSVLVYWAFI